MKFELIQLPYASNALEQVISQQTIEFHHGKHLLTYVNNLNNLIQGTPQENATLDEIVKSSEGAIFNNGAQVYNHRFYFEALQASSAQTTAPSGALADAITETFGSFEAFKQEFSATAASIFGSGWAWLSKDADGKLLITKESNAGNPLKSDLTPILVFDVWEHAYYPDYQNRRADHIEALWSIIDWNVVGSRY